MDGGKGLLILCSVLTSQMPELEFGVVLTRTGTFEFLARKWNKEKVVFSGIILDEVED